MSRLLIPAVLRSPSNGRASWLLWFLAYLLFLLLPSSHVVHRFLGWSGFGIYILLATLFFVAWHRFYDRWTRYIGRRIALILLLFTSLFLLVSFIYFFPRADAGIIGGGSDRDDALNVAVRELIDGHYPYYARTYLDNPISPLPGSLLLSAPFVMLGDSAYQNFFWLAALVGTAWWYREHARHALAFLWFILASAPIVLHEIFTGSDLLANSIVIFLFTLLLFRWQADFRKRLAVSVLLGVGLASRAHFWLLLPLVFAFLGRRQGYRSASFFMLASALSFLALTLPFFLYDPAEFAPLHTAGRLAVFGVRPPFTWLIPLLTAVLALLLTFRPWKTFDDFALVSAILLVTPFAIGLGATALMGDVPRLRLISYGVSALPFGAWFVWSNLMDTAS